MYIRKELHWSRVFPLLIGTREHVDKFEGTIKVIFTMSQQELPPGWAAEWWVEPTSSEL